MASWGPLLVTTMSYVPGEPTVQASLPRAQSAPAGRERRSDASQTVPTLESAVPAPARDGLWLVGGLLGLQGLDPTLTCPPNQCARQSLEMEDRE